MTESGKVRVKVWCNNPEKGQKPFFKTFEVPSRKGLTALNVLEYIYRKLDSSITYYSSCRIGKCGGCTIKINGKTKLACTTRVEGEEIIFEPVNKEKVIRDLMIER